MACLRRQLLDPTVPRPAHRARSTRRRTRGATPTGLILLAALAATALRCGAQISDGAGRLSDASVFVTVGGQNTQFPYYADNALGFDSGFSYQPSKLLGFEARVGSYPYHARFVQTPITGAYRIASDSFFGFPYAPFASFGGGVSRSQKEGMDFTSTSPIFTPCWKVDIGLDRPYAKVSWRVVQISYGETYGSQQAVRNLSLSTGLVYRIRR